MEKGEIVALLGANGSAKSTLVKILGGTVKKDAGTIKIDQKPVEIRSSAESRNLKIAVAYQELSLIPKMTVYENVMMGHFIKGKFGQVDERKTGASLLVYWRNRRRLRPGMNTPRISFFNTQHN
jgi:ABC-type sugar transport system ATPase subunit